MLHIQRTIYFNCSQYTRLDEFFCVTCAGLLDHVTVLIGIAINGEAVAGVIHQPYFNYESKEPDIELGRTIWGIVGLGQSFL